MVRSDGKPDPLIFFHLKLVAKIALSVAAAACAGLLLVLHLISNNKGGGYAEMLSAYSLAHDQLQMALFIFGLAVVTFAGITTWLIALYSSFRIAGPLFRFSRNLELEIERGPTAIKPIRSTDQLQGEWQEFDASVMTLSEHYAALRQAVGDIELAMQNGSAESMPATTQAIERLQEIERRARL